MRLLILLVLFRKKRVVGLFGVDRVLHLLFSGSLSMFQEGGSVVVCAGDMEDCSWCRDYTLW